MSSFPPSSWSRPSTAGGPPPHRPLRVAPPAPNGGIRLLDGVAELVHRGSTFSPAPLLAGATPIGTQVRIDAWEVAAAPDPLDRLIGWLAPDEWEVVGLTMAGRRPGGHGCPAGASLDVLGDHLVDDLFDEPEDDHDDDDHDHGDRRLHLGLDDHEDRATVTVDRSGEARLVLGGPSGGLLRIDASGMPLSDGLLRLLGAPTPPPEHTPGSWVELRWLDRIAAIILDRPGRATWAEVATCHPLHDDRQPAEPTTLALATLAHEATTTWASLRSRWPDPPTDGHPPGIGRATSLAEWFDDGSYSRWVQRDLPPRDLLVEAVLANLPDEVAADLVQALVTT